mgnify:CR=1 FL=1
MFKNSFFIILFSACAAIAYAQPNAIHHEAELGISFGSAHYFGDLNRSRVNRPKAAAGLFFRKQFGSYVALRASVHASKLGYADKYNTTPFERQRNLSFNTNIAEFALQGDFNFFRFVPHEKGLHFTYSSLRGTPQGVTRQSMNEAPHNRAGQVMDCFAVGSQ